MSNVFCKPILAHQSGSLLTTGNAYVEIASFSIRGLKSKCFLLKSVTNDLLFKIEYSIDGTNFVIRLTDIAVTAGSFVVREDVTNAELRGLWLKCKISVKPAVNDVHGTGSFEFESGTL